MRERAAASRKRADEGYRLFGRPVSRLGMMLAGAATMTVILLLALPLLLPALTRLVNSPVVTPTGQVAVANPTSPRPNPTQAGCRQPECAVALRAASGAGSATAVDLFRQFRPGAA